MKLRMVVIVLKLLTGSAETKKKFKGEGKVVRVVGTRRYDRGFGNYKSLKGLKSSRGEPARRVSLPDIT